jgi:hypothetical protein
MILITDIKCPGCKLGTKVKFKRPFLGSVTVSYACSGCESHLQLRERATKFDPAKPVDKGQIPVDTVVTIVRPTMLLLGMLRMLREEAAMRAAPIEEEIKTESAPADSNQ